MRVLIVSLMTFSSTSYRGFLDEIAGRVDSLAVVTGDVPTRWSSVAQPKDPSSQYDLHTIRPRFGSTDATMLFPGLREIISDMNAEIIHVFAEPWQFLALQSLRAAKYVGASIGIHFYENGPRMVGSGGAVRRVVGSEILRRCDYGVGMTSQSAAVARTLSESVPVEVIPPPLGLGVHAAIEGREAIGTWFGERSNDRFRVAFVGHFAPHKGVEDLLRICDDLEAEFPLSVAMAGGGPLYDAVSRWGREKGHSIYGPLDRDSVLKLFGASNAIVIPSRTVPGGAEQFGRVAVEAMSEGTPVVAYDCGGLKEVIGDAGYVVPEGDREALKDAIRTIASMSALQATELRERTTSRAWSFTDAAIADSLVSLWRRVLKADR